MLDISSSCSLRNHCMYCSPIRCAPRGDLREGRDLLGDPTLLGQRQGDRLDGAAEGDLRRGHPGDDDLLAGVEEVLDEHHGVVSLLDRLAVEERGQLGERLGVVPDGNRDVLLRGAELVADLGVERVGERDMRSTSGGGRGLRADGGTLERQSTRCVIHGSGRARGRR